MARQLPTARGGRVAADPGLRCPGPDVLLVTKLHVVAALDRPHPETGERPPGLHLMLTSLPALLAADMPNPRIARELVLTLDTVKKHVSHLLGKLGAANRTEAVTRYASLA